MQGKSCNINSSKSLVLKKTNNNNNKKPRHLFTTTFCKNKKWVTLAEICKNRLRKHKGGNNFPIMMSGQDFFIHIQLKKKHRKVCCYQCFKSQNRRCCLNIRCLISPGTPILSPRGESQCTQCAFYRKMRMYKPLDQRSFLGNCFFFWTFYGYVDITKFLLKL